MQSRMRVPAVALLALQVLPGSALATILHNTPGMLGPRTSAPASGTIRERSIADSL
ncbi:MAG TPA: hypothetical protein VLD17_06605 [Gemmatimonadaceae bacterium]|nr:hypothetical protein [Gemmatimonadaceae bacterium]